MTPGILPSALRASLREFEFAAGESVEPIFVDLSGFELKIVIPVLVLAALLALPWMTDHEHRALDEDARASAPGEYVRLAEGWTHYRSGGAEGDPALVLVHGFNGPMSTWDKNFEVLVEAGYRVLAYDLIGRGYSDRPPARYDLDLFIDQLDELLTMVGYRQPLVLIGSSFGCVVATEFALRYPERATALALIGPAGFPSPADQSAWLLNIPLVSDYLYALIGDRLMISLTRKYYVEPDRFPEAQRAFAEQLAFRGHKRAALSTMQNAPLRDYASGWRRLGALGKPVLLIWGREDVSFPYANHRAALDMMPQTKLITIDGAAHLPQYEQPERVNAALLDFLAAPTGHENGRKTAAFQRHSTR